MAGTSRRRAALAALIAGGVWAIAFAGTAQAAFPGTNGLIAFSPGVVIPNGDPPDGSQVYTITPGGAGLTQLTNVAAHRGGAAAPSWSSDGKRIVYESTESGSFQIWVMNADGTGQTQLTHGKGFEAFLPSFSPDNQRIVFSRCDEPFGFPASCDIDAMNADGTGVKKLVGGRRYNIHAEFSPDGQTIAFQSDRAGAIAAVWTVRSDGSKLRRLTPVHLEAFWPDWSPSGQTILFADNWDRLNSNLWTVKPNGKRLKRLTHLADRSSSGGFGVYSPDGQKIALDPERGCPKNPCLEALDADGSTPQKIPTGVPNGGAPYLIDWGPAG